MDWGKPTVYSGSDGLSILADQRTCIVIEPDHHAILSLQLFGGPNHYRMLDISSLHSVPSRRRRGTTWRVVTEGPGLLDDNDDSIPLYELILSSVISGG